LGEMVERGRFSRVPEYPAVLEVTKCADFPLMHTSILSALDLGGQIEETIIHGTPQTHVWLLGNVPSGKGLMFPKGPREATHVGYVKPFVKFVTYAKIPVRTGVTA
jgi:hypothetical protein